MRVGRDKGARDGRANGLKVGCIDGSMLLGCAVGECVTSTTGAVDGSSEGSTDG